MNSPRQDGEASEFSTVSARHRLLSLDLLLGGWAKVRRARYLETRRDGRIQETERDLNDRGDGVTTLLFDPKRSTVLLLRQPRIAATLRGDPSGETLEACSGFLGCAEPRERACQEVEEETGYVPLNLTAVASVYGSPGGSLEIVHLFIAEYDHAHRVGPGGGSHEEDEDIEVMEMTLHDALELTRQGAVRDARTILLLQHLAIQAMTPTACSDPPSIKVSLPASPQPITEPV